MEFRRSTSYSLSLFYLFNLVDFVWTVRCSNSPECKPGTIFKDCRCITCPPDRFIIAKSSHQRCEFCTQPCRAERHLVQIKDCTTNSNRECHCDRGYYCESTAQYTCRRCNLCPDGTFMDTTSRLSSCKLHTNCGRLGMALILTGNRTHDNICANINTSPAPRTLPIMNGWLRVRNTMKQNFLAKKTTSTVSTKSFALETEIVTDMWNTQTPRKHSKRAITGGDPKTSQLEQSADNFQSWPWLIVLFMVLVLLLGFGKCYKNLALRKKCLPPVKNAKQEQWGSWKDHTTVKTLKHLESEGNPSPSALHPLVGMKGEGLGLDGVEMGPGSLQQVTADHTSGRENVNNTVGSIFIYSPGTVILGTTASEQKGEEVKNAEEGQAITNAPQQETREENKDPIFQDKALQGAYVRGCVEEAEKKELCYPIPATGK